MIFSVTATDFSAYCVRTQITEMILHTLFYLLWEVASEEILLQAEYEAPFIHGIKQSR